MAWGVHDYPDPPLWWQLGPDDGYDDPYDTDDEEDEEGEDEPLYD